MNRNCMNRGPVFSLLISFYGITAHLNNKSVMGILDLFLQRGRFGSCNQQDEKMHQALI